MASQVAQSVTLFLAFLPLLGQEASTKDTLFRVAGWTPAGDRLNKIWVTMSSSSGREKFAANGRDVEMRIPTGTYLLDVEAPGFAKRQQIVKALQPSTFRSAVLPVAPLHGDTPTIITGSVHNYDGNLRNVRIRLMPLYGAEIQESLINADGGFSFPADNGQHLLLVIADLKAGATILYSRLLRIDGSQVIPIDLKVK